MTRIHKLTLNLLKAIEDNAVNLKQQYIACEMDELNTALRDDIKNDYLQYCEETEDPCGLLDWLTDGIDNSYTIDQAHQIMRATQ